MLKKIVNGIEVVCSDEEESEIIADRVENSRPRTTEETDIEKTLEADIEVKFDSTLKAFALVVLSEINILRVESGLPERTVQQLKDAIKAKL